MHSSVSTNNEPLVSVIIPCRNGGRWLAETLRSVAAQTHRHLEVIVVDDGSTDASCAIARNAGLPLRVIEQRAQGGCAARNRGFAESQGELIQFLDADDVLSPGKIAAQVQRWRECGDRCVYFGPYARFKHDTAEGVFQPTNIWRDLDPLGWLINSWRGGGMMPPHAWLTPRALVQRAGPWNETLLQNQDGEFFSRVLMASEAVRWCADAAVWYRSGWADSVSNNQGEPWRASQLRGTEMIGRRLLVAEDSPRVHQAYANALLFVACLVYPQWPHLAARAEAEWSLLQAQPQITGKGPAFRLLAAAVGWRAARRVQQISGFRNYLRWQSRAVMAAPLTG